MRLTSSILAIMATVTASGQVAFGVQDDVVTVPNAFALEDRALTIGTNETCGTTMILETAIIVQSTVTRTTQQPTTITVTVFSVDTTTPSASNVTTSAFAYNATTTAASGGYSTSTTNVTATSAGSTTTNDSVSQAFTSAFAAAAQSSTYPGYNTFNMSSDAGGKFGYKADGRLVGSLIIGVAAVGWANDFILG